jgi:hypothetical protein
MKFLSKVVYLLLGAMLAIISGWTVFFMKIEVPASQYREIEGTFCKEEAFMNPEECHYALFPADTVFKHFVPVCPEYVVFSREWNSFTVFPTYYLKEGTCHFMFYDLYDVEEN